MFLDIYCQYNHPSNSTINGIVDRFQYSRCCRTRENIHLYGAILVKQSKISQVGLNETTALNLEDILSEQEGATPHFINETI